MAARSGGTERGADAVTLLTILVGIRLALPSQLVIGPLGGAGAPATLVGLLLLSYWFWHRLHRLVPERGAAVNVATFLFAVVVLASYAVEAARPMAATEEFKLSTLSVLSLGGWMGGLLLASDGVTSWAQLRALVARVAILGSAFAGFGLFQFITGKAWVDKLSIPGLVANRPVYSLTQRGGFSRPFSTAIHPIEFGSVIGMVLPLTIAFGLLGSGRGGRLRYWIPAIATALAASLSSSRSTLVGLALGLVLLWPALSGLQRLVGGVVSLALGSFIFVTVPGMLGTVLGLFGGIAANDSSVASRLDSFPVAMNFFARSPLIGRGFGTFLPRYWIFDDQYLGGLVETGVLGVAAMILLWLVPVVGIARVLRRSAPGSPERILGSGLLASCVVGAAGLAFFDGFGFPMMPAIWFVMLGLSGAYTRLAATTSA